MKAPRRETAATRSGDVTTANPTRTEILDAATKLIVERGYSGCTMRAVADSVNIKAGSLYYHFSSKDEIIEEILNSGIATLLQQVQARLDSFSASAAFAERLEAAVQTHISCMIGPGTRYMQVYEHLPPVLKRRSKAMRDKYARLWFELFELGMQKGEVDPDLNLLIVVPYLLGGLNRIPEWYRPSKFRPQDVAEIALRILSSGLTVGRNAVLSRSASPPARRTA